MGLMPEYAKPIVEARKRGLTPAGMVIVSDGAHGFHRRFTNPVVQTDPAIDPQRYDWSWVPGLSIQVATTMDRVQDFVSVLVKHKPRHLSVWTQEDGAIREHTGVAGFPQVFLYEHGVESWN